MAKQTTWFLIAALSLATVISSVNLISPTVQAKLESVRISPKDDTYITNASLDANFGSENGLYVGTYAQNYYEIWLRFNLSEIPVGQKMKSATLEVFRKSTLGTPSKVFVQVFSAGADWNGATSGLGGEMTLTWRNKPSFVTNYTFSQFTGDKSSTTTFTQIPLNMSDVEYFSRTGNKLFSLVLRSPTQKDLNSNVEIYSKEGGDYAPQLTFVFSSEGIDSNSQMAVLVDRSVAQQTYYQNYVFGVGKWLEWWKMDFTEIDVSSIQITPSLLSKYGVIAIPQFNLAGGGSLDSSELQAIYQAVTDDGIGLVQIDAYLQGYMNIWSNYGKLFNITVNNWVSTSNRLNIVIISNTHFITEIYRNGTSMNYLFPNEEDWKESDMIFENVTLGVGATTLAVVPYSGRSYPAIIAGTHGKGKVVLSTFSTGRVSLGKAGYDGFGERANLKTTSGIHGLLWRSIVWTSENPFTFIGMPPFITFRVDDIAVNTYDPIYVDELLKYGFFVNLYLLQDNALAGGSIYQNLLKNYYLNGSVYISPHAWNYETNIYWDQARNAEYSNSTLSRYFSWLDANYSAWGITPSALFIPHSYQTGQNAVRFLQERGWVFTSSIYQIPYSAGVMTDRWIWDADWKRVAHLDYADAMKEIFNVDVEMPVGSASYATQDCLESAESNPAKAAKQILSSLEHGLSDLFWAEAFTHEQKATGLSKQTWDKTLGWIIGNITAQYPFTISASKEYIARYTFNREHVSISNQEYSDNVVTLNFSGSSTMPLAFYLFTDKKISAYSGTLDYFRGYGNNGYLVWLPPFSVNHQVTITLGDLETDRPHIKSATANVTSTQSSPSQLRINARPIWKHDTPIYSFEIDSARSGKPESMVSSEGVSLNFAYDNKSGMVSFNKTLPTEGIDIILTWADQEPANHWQMTFDHQDMDNNNLDSRITWQLYKGSQRLIYEEGRYALSDGNYTLKTYYHGKLINQTNLNTALYGNKSVSINLQMKPHTSVPGGYIAFNSTISSITLYSQTSENLTFIAKGPSPISILADVPRNCSYVKRNDTNQTGWIYIEDVSGPNYTYIETQQLSRWEYYFPCIIPTAVNVWQFTFDHRDLDNNAVDSKITWKLYNGSSLLSYGEGQYALLSGIYTLKTYYHSMLIDQVNLDTTIHGNSTIVIPLQMKPHQSVAGGYVAFNNTVTSITISSQTGENLTFTAEGLTPILIIADVPRNCSYIKRNGVNQIGWKYVQDLTSSNYTYIGATSLSKWEYFFPRTPPAQSSTFGKKTIGGSTGTVPVGYVFSCRFQAPENGLATMISAYIKGRYQSGSVKALIYSDNKGTTGSLLYESNQITLRSTWAWHNFSIGGYQLQAGTYYWFAIFSSVESQYKYASGLAKQQAVAWGWVYPNALARFNGAYGPNYSSKVDSIYVAYTPLRLGGLMVSPQQVSYEAIITPQQIRQDDRLLFSSAHIVLVFNFYRFVDYFEVLNNLYREFFCIFPPYRF